MGAWIEILQDKIKTTEATVAPCMGAWIEIFKKRNRHTKHPQSHPAWVRGLKLFQKSKKDRKGSRTLHGCVD